MRVCSISTYSAYSTYSTYSSYSTYSTYSTYSAQTYARTHAQCVIANGIPHKPHPSGSDLPEQKCHFRRIRVLLAAGNPCGEFELLGHEPWLRVAHLRPTEELFCTCPCTCPHACPYTCPYTCPCVCVFVHISIYRVDTAATGIVAHVCTMHAAVFRAA